ncbi:MAG: glutathionylspermidine synthase family protein [Defluviitaleaceae bacterium]|nr:glutathionylspermidine synthase family protein [Defluviitaleaceae bacterium]
MKNLNLEYAALVRADFEKNIADGAAVKRYMDASTAVYHGIPQPCLYIPKIFSHDAWKFLQTAAADIHRILQKVIARYLTDAEYRRLFAFDAELEELILSDADYPQLLPIARLDIFFNEDDFSFKFCEFNADGASAMNEDREINNALRLSDTFLGFAREHALQSCELFDSWVREFQEILSSREERIFNNGRITESNPESHPDSRECAETDIGEVEKKIFVAIVDFMDAATGNEFVEFREAFRRAGFACEICEIRDLLYVGGELKTAAGVRIDAVYRRAVTCDIMRRRDEVRPFLQAARDRGACIVGHFRTQIIHNKIIFEILRREETLGFLTEHEREFILRHVPETLPLVRGAFDPAEVVRNKDDWLIKPEDSYASRGVFAGIDMDAAAWAAAVEGATDTGYILQKFCPPYRTENLDFNESERPEFKTYNNITGLYVYNGKLAGLYSRAGLAGIISGGTQGLTMASVVEAGESK